MFSPLPHSHFCPSRSFPSARYIFPSRLPLLYPFSNACQFTHFTVLFFASSLFISLSGLPHCLPGAYFYIPLHSFLLVFIPLSVLASQQQTNNNNNILPKQPSERCRLLGYPAAIIASHYSWDLPFNPGYVIGLLFSVQAGLTPQTSIHSAALLHCYRVSTNKAR